MENTFKNALFGGFNRDDVIRYIERTALESNQRIDALEKENDGLCRENSSLRKEVDSVTAARDRLSGSCTDLIRQNQSAKASLTEAKAQLSAAYAQIAALESEKDELQSTVAQLRQLADEYATVKAHISEIELSARQRADDLKEHTRCQLKDMIGVCRQQCDLITATLNETCANVSGELRRLDTSVTQLPAAFNTMRTDLTELEKLE